MGKQDQSMDINLIELLEFDKKLQMRKLKAQEIEAILIQWLNKNILKQKSGTFVPLCVMKWCLVQDDKLDFKHISFQFFIASLIDGLNLICDFWK